MNDEIYGEEERLVRCGVEKLFALGPEMRHERPQPEIYSATESPVVKSLGLDRHVTISIQRTGCMHNSKLENNM